MSSGSAGPAVAARALTMTFGEGATRVEALRGVDLTVERGEFLAVMGASGSGKSTLLHLMAGLARPTSGAVLVDGVDLSALDDDALTRLRRRRIGLVFQSFNLLPVLTAVENVALPLAVDGVPRAESERRARAALERVGLDGRRDHLPSEMSGGEQQRVAIARALVAEPVLLLADEPTGNLDRARGSQVMDLLAEASAGQGRTLVMVTHDGGDASRAHRVIHLVDGRLTDAGVPPREDAIATSPRGPEAR